MHPSDYDKILTQARDPRTSPDTLEILSHHEDLFIVKEVAGNRSTSEEILHMLVTHKHPVIAQEASAHLYARELEVINQKCKRQEDINVELDCTYAKIVDVIRENQGFGREDLIAYLKDIDTLNREWEEVEAFLDDAMGRREV